MHSKFLPLAALLQTTLAQGTSYQGQTTETGYSTVTSAFSTITGSVISTTTSSTATGVPFADAPSLVEVASATDELSTFLSLLQQERFSGLLDSLTESIFTCLAPTNQAFEQFLETENGQRFKEDDEYATALLEYHTLLGYISAQGFSGEGFLASEWYRTFYYRPGNTPLVDARVGGYTDADGTATVVSGYLNTAAILEPNLQFSGGYVHVIDQVLTLPPSLQDALVAGGFTSLLGAIALSTDAGLDPLDGALTTQPTVFAPTNEAFQNIGSALESLSAEDLTALLRYHIVDALAFASNLEDGQELTTLANDTLTVTIQEGDDGPKVFVNGARVVQPNIVLSAGVVHGIDQVLNPMNKMMPAEGAMEGAVQFDGAESADCPPLTSGQPTPTTTITMPGETGGSDYSKSSSSVAEQQTDNAGTVVTGMPVIGMLAAGGIVVAAW